MTERAGFTPGPWEADTRCKVHAGKVKIATADVWGAQWSAKKANARLIAAAPELYEACEKAQRLIDDMARFVGQMALSDYANFNEAPMALTAALAKARGETPNLSGQGSSHDA